MKLIKYTMIFSVIVAATNVGGMQKDNAQNGMSQSSPANGVSREQFDKESKAKLARAQLAQANTTVEQPEKPKTDANKKVGLLLKQRREYGPSLAAFKEADFISAKENHICDNLFNAARLNMDHLSFSSLSSHPLNQAIMDVKRYKLDINVPRANYGLIPGMPDYDESFKGECFGDTALHVAARRGNYWNVYSLLNAGADYCSLNDMDETPICVVRNQLAAGTASYAHMTNLEKINNLFESHIRKFLGNQKREERLKEHGINEEIRILKLAELAAKDPSAYREENLSSETRAKLQALRKAAETLWPKEIGQANSDKKENKKE